jgi:hypothetical protein
VVTAELVVVFAILLPVTLTATWAHRTVVNTDAYVATITPIAASPQVHQPDLCCAEPAADHRQRAPPASTAHTPATDSATSVRLRDPATASTSTTAASISANEARASQRLDVAFIRYHLHKKPRHAAKQIRSRLPSTSRAWHLW